MTTPTWLAERYRQHWSEAENPAGAPLDPSRVLSKALEEMVEALVAAGLPFQTIRAVFDGAIFKEAQRQIAKPLPDSLPRLDLPGLRLELADVEICLRTARGLFGITSAEHQAEVAKKCDLNDKRKWAVNEFGSLSNRGLKPEAKP